jgi:hypothetical protein
MVIHSKCQTHSFKPYKGTAAGTCSAVLFGDFSKLVIGQWGFMDLSVDDKSRKKEGYIEITANVYLDVAVLEPTAFTVCKDNNCLILKKHDE